MFRVPFCIQSLHSTGTKKADQVTQLPRNVLDRLPAGHLAVPARCNSETRPQSLHPLTCVSAITERRYQYAICWDPAAATGTVKLIQFRTAPVRNQGSVLLWLRYRNP